MTRKRTPLEWAFTLGTIGLILWLQTPGAAIWWASIKWRLHQKEEQAKIEALFQKALAHVQYEAWEAVNYPKESGDSNIDV